jgi:hypothetical protein
MPSAAPTEPQVKVEDGEVTVTIGPRVYRVLGLDAEHDAKQKSLEILALAYDGHVNLCGAFGPPSEGIRVARSASPGVRIGRREDDVVRIGPIVVRAFPNAAGAFGDVGRRAVEKMHLEVLVGAVSSDRSRGSTAGDETPHLTRAK